VPGNWEESDFPAAFSPDLRQVAMAWGNTVRLWDATSTSEDIACQCHRGGVNALAFAHDDRHVASVMDDGTIRVWDTASGLQVLNLGQERIGGSTEHAAGIAFGPGDQWLAATRGPEVTLWDLPSGKPLVQLKGSEASAHDELRGGWGVTSLAVSPDGEWLAASTWYYHPDAAGEFKLYRVRDLGLPAVVGAGSMLGAGPTFGAGLPTPPEQQPGQPTAEATSPAPVVLLRGREYEAVCLAFSPDSRQLASADYSETVTLWDIRSLVTISADDQGAGLAKDQVEATLARHSRTLTAPCGVNGVAYSPDGGLLAIAGSDATVRLFDPATDRQVRVLRGHAKEVRCVAFSPDGTQLVSGGGELKVWDVATGQELLSLGSVGCLAFSHCGKRLAVAGHVGRPFCHPDFDRVAASILDGRPLTDEIRIQREAVSLYRGAAQTQLLQAEVVEQLRQDRSVSDAVRQQALAWAEHHHGDPDRLQKAAWPVVRRPGATAEEYRRALRCAEAADRGQPGHTQQLLTLGIAQYRAAQYQEALATLTRVQQLMRAKDEAERARQQMQSPNPTSWSISFEPFPFLVADEAFLAMAHYRLGQKERGRAQLEELRRSLKRLEELHWPRDPDSEAFVRETEALFQEGNP
jgi:WD40 repeat protein